MKKEELHGYFHTFQGALVAAILSIAIGWPVCIRIKKAWEETKDLPLKEFFGAKGGISIMAAVNGSIIGAFSHVMLDGIMHPDVLVGANLGELKLFGLVGAGTLHLICFLLGIIALFLWRCRKQ